MVLLVWFNSLNIHLQQRMRYTTHLYVIVDGASACWVPRWRSHTPGTCEVSQKCGGIWHGAPTRPMWWTQHHTLCTCEALCLCACSHGSSGMQKFWTHGCRYHIYEAGLQSEISYVWSAGSALGSCSCSRCTSAQSSSWGIFSWVWSSAHVSTSHLPQCTLPSARRLPLWGPKLSSYQVRFLEQSALCLFRQAVWRGAHSWLPRSGLPMAWWPGSGGCWQHSEQ